MFVIEKTIEIKAPVGIVWEVLTDLRRYPDWNPFCLSCSSTLRPGDPIEMTVKLGRRPQKQVETMLSHVEGEGFSYCMKPVPGMLSSFRAHSITAMGPESTRYRSTFHLKQWFRHVVLALFRDKLEVGFASMTDAVKARAEKLWEQRRV